MDSNTIAVAALFCVVGGLIMLALTWVWGLVPFIFRWVVRSLFFSLMHQEGENKPEEHAVEARAFSDTMDKRTVETRRSVDFEAAVSKYRHHEEPTEHLAQAADAPEPTPKPTKRVSPLVDHFKDEE